MPVSRRQALRIVLQHLGDEDRYRLIAYGDAVVYHPLEFTSLAAAIGAIRHLVADIDENAFSSKNGASQIVFAADVNVDESQVRDCGLSRRP